MSEQNNYKDPRVCENITNFLEQCMPDVSPTAEFYHIIVDGIFANIKNLPPNINSLFENSIPKI